MTFARLNVSFAILIEKTSKNFNLLNNWCNELHIHYRLKMNAHSSDFDKKSLATLFKLSLKENILNPHSMLNE